MHKKHLIVAVLAFMTCTISTYFGVRIYNANENIHLTELNEIDNIRHDDISLVPALSMLAGLITLPFLLAIITIQIIAIRKSAKKSVRNIAIGMFSAACIILIFDLLTLNNPEYFDFSKWGFVWICLGLIIAAGSVLSVAIYRFSTPDSKDSH